jgi:hypothetical protein
MNNNADRADDPEIASENAFRRFSRVAPEGAY